MRQLKRISAAFAVAVIMITLCTTTALATNINADAVGGGNAGTDKTLPDSSKIDSDDGAWEVSFFDHGKFRGGFLIGDPEVMLKASGNNMDAVDYTPWFFSGGDRLANGTSATISIVLKPVPRYGAASEVIDWGTNPEIMGSIILDNVLSASAPAIKRGNMTVTEKDFIIQMIKDAADADQDTIDAKMESKEWFPFFVTMRPVMLTLTLPHH